MAGKTDEFGRTCAWVDPDIMDRATSNKNVTSQEKPPPEGKDENLIVSWLYTYAEVAPDRRMHRPVLDIDFPARLVPSSTEGHFHLYLDGVLIPHDKYMYLLAALASCGIISEGYLKHSTERGGTAVRMPGSYKPKMALDPIGYQPKHMMPPVQSVEELMHRDHKAKGLDYTDQCEICLDHQDLDIF
jgi:hypothetical protein